MEVVFSDNYREVLSALKEKVKQAKMQAAVAVNQIMLTAYWEIGAAIEQQVIQTKWGKKVVDQFVMDLQAEFPDMKGFGARNLHYMRKFAREYPEFPTLQRSVAEMEGVENDPTIILQRTIAKLSWGHNCSLLDKVGYAAERLFYAAKAVEHGWTRDMMDNQIATQLYQRMGALINNFKTALPAYDSELALQIFKDPYHLDFVTLGSEARERDLENALMDHIVKLLLELGDGFAFVGRQKRFYLNETEFVVDLVFYHTVLRRFIIIDLKIGEFKPEYVSKMNVYLGIADNQLKKENDEASIGLILCKTRDKVVAEYSLRDIISPIGVAEYHYKNELPPEIKSELPSEKELEQKLDREWKLHEAAEDKIRRIKERIQKIQIEPVRVELSLDIQKALYNDSLQSLFEQLIYTLDKFREDFHDVALSWNTIGKIWNSLQQLNEFFLHPDTKAPIQQLNFQYLLRGFKKGGTELWSNYVQLNILFDTFTYEFTLVNYNDQRPFFKKLYHQPITTNESEMICRVVLDNLVKDIDRMIDRMDAAKT